MALIDNFSKEELEKIVKESHSMKQVIDSLGYSTHSGSNHKTVKSRLEKFNIDTFHFTFAKRTERNKENIFVENSTASQKTLRDWYFKGKYTEYVCSICGQKPYWQGKDLTLILDHINGSNHDDRLENLRWVCPNCNQQLDTTNARNIQKQKQKHKEYFCDKCGVKITRGSKLKLCPICAAESKRVCERPSRNKLKEMIRTLPFTTIAKQYGVSDKAISKWCVAENLPSKKGEIKSYSDEEWDII